MIKPVSNGSLSSIGLFVVCERCSEPIEKKCRLLRAFGINKAQQARISMGDPSYLIGDWDSYSDTTQEEKQK